MNAKIVAQSPHKAAQNPLAAGVCRSGKRSSCRLPGEKTKPTREQNIQRPEGRSVTRVSCPGALPVV